MLLLLRETNASETIRNNSEKISRFLRFQGVTYFWGVGWGVEVPTQTYSAGYLPTQMSR